MSYTEQQIADFITARTQRKFHYAKSCDPLMALYMNEEITKEEWQQKKQEVKNSLPYPDGVTGSEIEQYCKDNGYIGD